MNIIKSQDYKPEDYDMAFIPPHLETKPVYYWLELVRTGAGCIGEGNVANILEYVRKI